MKGHGLAAGILTFLGAAGAAAAAAPDGDVAVLRMVASVHPLEAIVRELGGDRVQVATLVPPGATPHTFEPRPSDMERLARADAFLRVGGGLDGWARPLLAAAPADLARWTAVESADLEPLAGGHDHGGHEETGSDPGADEAVDPHVWLDPIRVRDALLPDLEALLARLDPEDAAGYARRRRAFAERLTALDAEIRQTLDRAPGRRYVAFHNAWRYFADRYGLQEIGVVQEFAGEEPTPREVARLVRAAREAGVPAILVEPQLSPRTAEVMGSEFGARTVVVDPMGDPRDPERRGYLPLMRFNARAFARALGAPP